MFLSQHQNNKTKKRRKTEQALLDSLKAALNNRPILSLQDDVIKEAKYQTVLPLVCSDIEAYPVIASNVQIMWEQQNIVSILSNIPFIVLKGSCAAVYYPEPLRRTLGDIDVLVSPTHFDSAYKALKEAGYATNDLLNGKERHVHFKHGTTIVELHRRYAVLQDKIQEKMLDDWLFHTKPVTGTISKYTFPMPNNELNGLVLLAHINQHLEQGLGLRHLLDWVMYVKECLPDDKWPSFQEKSDLLGLTTIAKVVARLGQMYFDINTDRNWCSDANEQTVENLLDYIFEWGNFGHKDIKNNAAVMVMSHGRGVKGFFKNLQHQGIHNWTAINTHPYLKLFAWMYQLGRYFKIGIKSFSIRDFVRNYQSSKNRNRLMDELGATRLVLRK